MKKELYEDFFTHKKVTALGLGLLGRGVGDADFLLRHNVELIITDKKTKDELASSLEKLSSHTVGVTYHLGEHVMEDFEHRDFILQSAGVPFDSPYVLHAKEQGIPVYMSAALVVDIVKKTLPGVVVIGVTGTRGKSTTTALIAHMLSSSGMSVTVAGNVRGVANLPVLETIEDDSFLVLELDSWQLQGFGDLQISPHIAVFTNFLDDHLNYYRGDKEHYFRDKANIYRHQTDGDVLITSAQAHDEIRSYGDTVEAIIPDERHFQMKLIGAHNHTLANLAYEVGLQCGLSEEEVEDAIRSFAPVPGRLEYCGMFRGVHVINDNNATTGDAVVAGIRAVAEAYNKKPIVICGGKDKELDVEALACELSTSTKEVVYLSGSGTDKIHLEKKYEFDRLEDCVATAFSLAEEGDVILFSPGFASFSAYFNNEYERNDCFLEILKKYT